MFGGRVRQERFYDREREMFGGWLKEERLRGRGGGGENKV